MSVGLPSDEVAEDYKSSLEDLTINSRFEINNLTVIAKENTEHALAISRVLENHIKNVSTDRLLSSPSPTHIFMFLPEIHKIQIENFLMLD